MKQIPGEVLRISSATVEDFTARLQGTKGFIEKDFYEEYQFHIIMKQRIARAAKVFLIHNWEKVNDWTKMDVVIRDNSKTKTKYYNHVPQVIKEDINEGHRTKTEDTFDRIMAEHDEWMAKKHNPVVSLTEMVLDPTDEDFSVTINGKNHNWIDNDSVIIIADYVEKQLAAQQS